MPSGDEVLTLEGKLFQKDEHTAAFWKVLRQNYSLDRSARIRRPTSKELAGYSAMISFDIAEPIFMIETKEGPLLADLSGDDLRSRGSTTSPSYALKSPPRPT